MEAETLLMTEHTREAGRGGVGRLGLMHTPITSSSIREKQEEEEKREDSVTTHVWSKMEQQGRERKQPPSTDILDRRETNTRRASSEV